MQPAPASPWIAARTVRRAMRSEPTRASPVHALRLLRGERRHPVRMYVRVRTRMP